MLQRINAKVKQWLRALGISIELSKADIHRAMARTLGETE
jgi:hypothetical protein